MLKMAHDEMARGCLFHLRLADGAIFSGGFTSRMETASLGRVEGAWHFAFQDDVFPLRFNGGVRDGDGGEECARTDGRLRDLAQGVYFRSSLGRVPFDSQCRTKVW